MNWRAFLAVIGYAACVPAANWMIRHVGTVCVDAGPCLVPVAPGLMAPSGVVAIGVALVLRDVVHSQLGLRGVMFAVAAGSALSFATAPASLVGASTAAFLLSELADTAIYQPLYAKRFLWAVAISSLVGSVIDSAAFLWLAFGSLEFIAGQIVGKCVAVLATIPVLYFIRIRAAVAR